MMMYCKTIDEQMGQRVYGIDVMEYADGNYEMIASIPDVTDNWSYICRLVNWLNEIELPPEMLLSFLGYDDG